MDNFEERFIASCLAFLIESDDADADAEALLVKLNVLLNVYALDVDLAFEIYFTII